MELSCKLVIIDLVTANLLLVFNLTNRHSGDDNVRDNVTIASPSGRLRDWVHSIILHSVNYSTERIWFTFSKLWEEENCGRIGTVDIKRWESHEMERN